MSKIAPKIYGRGIDLFSFPSEDDPWYPVSSGCHDCYDSHALYDCDGKRCCETCATSRGYKCIDNGPPVND